MIKPCYRNYISKIDTLFIGFRYEETASEEEKNFWAKKLPTYKIGETVGFVVQDFSVGTYSEYYKKTYPLFDFDSTTQW